MLKYTLILFLVFPAWCAFAQKENTVQRNNKGLMQLSAAFLTVSNEASIDLDSSLVLTAKYHHMSRSRIISDGIDDGYAEKYCKWIDDRQTGVARYQLSKLSGGPKVRLMLLLGAYYAFQPGFKKRDIDSCKYWLHLAEKANSYLKETRWIAQVYCMLGKCYLKAGKIRQASFYFNKVTRSPSLRDSGVVAKAWNYQGMYLPFLPSTTDRRIACLERAAVLLSDLHDSANLFNVLTNIAYLNFARQNIIEAERQALRSYQLQLNVKFPYSHYTSDLISLIHQVKGDYVGQLKYALESIDAADRSGDHMSIAIFYTRAGNAYAVGATKRDEAVKWYRKAFAEYMSNNDGAHAYKLLYYFINEDLGRSGNDSLLHLLSSLMISDPPTNSIDKQDALIALGECNRKLKLYEKAEVYFLQAEALMPVNERIRGNINQAEMIFILGQFYFYAGNYEKSRTYLVKLIKDPDAGNFSVGNLVETYWLLHQIDSQRRRYASSMLFLKRYNRLIDSLRHISDGSELARIKAHSKVPVAISENGALSSSNTVNRTIIVFLVLALLLIGMGVIFIFRFPFRIRKLSEGQQQKRLLAKAILDNKELRISKDKLIKEIHYRVQNNLKIVIDLLSRQSTFITDDDAIEAIEKSQSRMMAMSLIHQELDPSQNAEGVDLAAFISKMVSYLKEHYPKKASFIKFDLKLGKLNISFSQAVPLALIINETLSNSIKHAFLFQENAKIYVELVELSGGRVKLSMADNGSGLPDDFDAASSRTLGFNLILGLSGQVDAVPVFRNHHGLAVDLIFERKADSEAFL